MNNLEIFCICIHNKVLDKIKKLSYTPVGLGADKFSSEWIRDNSGINISSKNKFYGEFTFHYWLWKNKLKTIQKDKWIGFCGYRRFWKNEFNNSDKLLDLNDKILKRIPPSWEKYDVILGKHIFLNEIPLIKIIKYGKLAFLRNPRAIFNKGRSIRFQFDMFHGNGILDKAIDLLGQDDKQDFEFYVRKNISFNYGNMFICKSKELMSRFYETLFPWLEKCEAIIGFELKGYETRTYAFLAERFMAYWFNKYSKVHEIPVIYYDLNKEKS